MKTKNCTPTLIDDISVFLPLSHLKELLKAVYDFSVFLETIFQQHVARENQFKVDTLKLFATFG